ncbi:MAG: hypothetical protein WCY19_01235 [Candidatus Gastranaerophilaceae bacterium]
MSIEGFDYKEFAETLSSQADELVPAEFQDFQKNYVKNTVKNFATLSAEAIYNDTKANFTADQAMLITQIIAEWSFHKSVDVIRSGILPDYWDGIMQKIAFTIFEIAKQTISKGLPQDEILQIVEHHVKKTYQKVLEELKERKAIDQIAFDSALGQSNIDSMMKQIQDEKQALEGENPGQTGNQSNYKILKLASVALLLQQVSQDKVQTILNKFDPQDAQTIIQYMQTPDLGKKVDKGITMKCLQEIKTYLPEPKYISPSKIISKINKIFEKTTKEKVEKIVSKERPKVKELIAKALDGECPQMPSKVANIIAQHLEESV